MTTTGGTGSAVTYALSGADSAAFDISASGALSFKTSPNFEAPGDADRNNSYQVTIAASDNQFQAQLAIAIAVTNVTEPSLTARINATFAGAIQIVAIPGQSQVFVPQAAGQIYILDPATGQKTLYLAISDVAPNPTNQPDHRGLMSIALAPDYATSGTLYVFVIAENGDFELRRYGRLNPAAGDPASADVILRIPHTLFDQRGTIGDIGGDQLGGWIGFGPDGFLYATTGLGRQPESDASLLGKVLRLDVSRDDFPADASRDYGIPASNPFASGPNPPEVYAMGFEDPWRASFDGPNLYLGDQARGPFNISGLFLIRPQDAGQRFASTGTSGIPPVIGLTFQLAGSPALVVGGHVYRGPAADLAGQYIFVSDAGSSSTSLEGIVKVPVTNLVQGTTLSSRDCCSVHEAMTARSFGEDSSRNLFWTNGQDVYMIRAQ